MPHVSGVKEYAITFQLWICVLKLLAFYRIKKELPHEDFRTLAFYEGLLQAKGSYITFVDDGIE